MTYSTTITKKGQITIPKEIREILRLKEGERIFLEVEKKKKEIRIKSEPSIFELAGKFKPKKVENAVKLREKMAKMYKPR
ncbi:AbrB/MazE/SpoVT family DNA-binding domain-containing protein [Candidatus Parcubacteria bacterium]|nr:AbrB/MazE/SpoVT family DNA-binding domain-containing protein [Candidatus Parcubacteria bacterium]